MESVKRSTDETSTKGTVHFHEAWLKHTAFENIASNRMNVAKSCALIPNGLVHCFLEGLTLGIRAYCRAGWLSRFHPEVDRGPIVQPGFPLLHRNSLPEGSSQSSIADRIVGIRRHCNFTVAQADVARTATCAQTRCISIHRPSRHSVQHRPSNQKFRNFLAPIKEFFHTKIRPCLNITCQPTDQWVNSSNVN